MVYGFILSTLLARVLKDDVDLSSLIRKSTSSSPSPVIIKDEQLKTESTQLTTLITLIEHCIVQANKYLRSGVPQFINYSFKLKNQAEKLEEGKFDASKIHGQSRNNANTKTLRDSYKGELAYYYFVLKDADQIQKASKVTQDIANSNEVSAYSSTLESLVECCDPFSRNSSVGILKFGGFSTPNRDQIDSSTRTSKIADFLLKNKERIQSYLLPVLRGCCEGMPNIVSIYYFQKT